MICHYLGIDELYDDSAEHIDYEGALVLSPTKETARGKIMYYDFSSLYPSVYIMHNLFSSNCSCCKDNSEKWHGSEMFPNIIGYYCKKTPGKIENMIADMLAKRREMKKNKDPREKIYKICLNSIYGLSSSGLFKQVYRPNMSADCCKIAQSCIKYAMKKFIDAGYIVLMGDTDSCVIEVPENKTVEESKILAKQIAKELSDASPFPFSNFELKLEAEIKYMQFFRDTDGSLKKKNYIYVNQENQITIKGLDVIQKDCSQISKYIFETIVKPKILNELDCKFKKSEIDKIIKDMLSKDITLIAKRFNIKNSKYKTNTSIYSLIKEIHGDGEILLVKNKRLGAGKSVKYCNLEQAKQLKFQDLDLSDVYSELEPFIIKENFQKTLF
jgi:DNA polymerase I